LIARSLEKFLCHDQAALEPQEPRGSEGSCRKYSISAETVRKYVAENRLTERDRLLLRGSAAMRAFAGCLDHSLDWLERFSPGVGARFRGHTLKRWQRNTAAMRACAGMSMGMARSAVRR